MKITLEYLLNKVIISNRSNSLEIYNFLKGLNLTYYQYQMKHLKNKSIYFKIKDKYHFTVDNQCYLAETFIEGNTITRKNKLKRILDDRK